jgi:hypothetical protein
MQSGEIRYKTQVLPSPEDLEAIVKAERIIRSYYRERLAQHSAEIGDFP